MEINLKKLGEQAVESTTGGKKMRLSENASSMVFQLFTKNVYSNPIGTVVREITSNCFDSHIEAKVNAPVIIRKSFDVEAQTHYISFVDFGVGMSPDRIENIYGVYFESTKRLDNTQIGGFGIGGKTPLAYKRSNGMGEGEYDNSFYVVTIFNGTKYYYCIYEGAESPIISLLHSEPTTERNGTEVRVPVLEKDVDSFSKEMIRQLYYFENVIFEGFDNDRYGETLMNTYQIIRGKSFLYRGSEYSDTIHLCLGRVAYPIDYNVLGLNSYDYRMPIALRLEVGEVNVTVSRESIDYSESTIKMLKKRLEAAKKEIAELLAKQYGNIVSLEDYFKVKNDFGKLYFSNGTSINVGKLINQKDIDFSNFKYGFLKMPNDKQLFKFFFESHTYGKKPKKSKYSNSSHEFEGGYDEIQNRSNLLYVENEFTRKVLKQAYLKSVHEMYHIINKRNLCSQFIRAEIGELFNVSLDKTVDDNGKPVPYVQSLIEMQEEYFAIVQRFAEDYDTVEVPEDFVRSRKYHNFITPEMRNTTIPVRFMGGSRYRVKLDTLFNYNSIIFYGTKDNEHELYKIHNMYCRLFDNESPVTYCDYHGKLTNGRYRNSDSKKTIMFVVLAEANVKYMQFCKKAYKPSEFYTRLLRRKEDTVKQYFQTFELVEKYGKLDEIYKSKKFSKIDSKWGKTINDVRKKMEAIPERSKNNSIGYMKAELSQYFDLSNINPNDEHHKTSKDIDDLLFLEASNENVLKHINMPYNFENIDGDLIDILKKIMEL